MGSCALAYLTSYSLNKSGESGLFRVLNFCLRNVYFFSQYGQIFGHLSPFSTPIRDATPVLGAPILSSASIYFSPTTRYSTQKRHDLCDVFDQSFVPSLATIELALDDTELMLDFGSNQSLQVLEFFECVTHPLALSIYGFSPGRLHSDMPGGFNVFSAFAFLDTGVARASPKTASSSP